MLKHVRDIRPSIFPKLLLSGTSSAEIYGDITNIKKNIIKEQKNGFLYIDMGMGACMNHGAQ